jgi:uncharacterized protein involved in outer membrane biogenesis
LALQTTLLGLAIAIILALLAALVGPLFIDWGNHRALFEAEASRLVGLNVRVAGTIDVRLLPSPRLTLHDIAIGEGRDTIRARSLGVEFALGSLMRGEWRAAEMHLVGPQVSLGLDKSGHVRAPSLAVTFKPGDLSVDRLSIRDGTVGLAYDANGQRISLEQVSFTGEARSLVGPIKGEGAFVVAGQTYPYRLAIGRLNDDGTLKLRANVDPADRSLGIEADGTIVFVAGEPRFEGTLIVLRPVGIAGRKSRETAQPLTQPWRASAKVKATGQSALMENIEFQYGSEEQGSKLTGVANLKFGAHPRFDGVLSGRQLDLDRALSDGTGERPSLGAAVRGLAELGAATYRTTLPVQIGIGVDLVTLGGSALQNLRGDISNGADGWNLERLEFRAPGVTQVRLSGRLAALANGFTFAGPAEVDASEPKVLAAWLEGRADNQQGDPHPMSMRGNVTLAADRIAVDNLKLEFNRKPLTGRFAYFFRSGNQPARLDTEVSAVQFDFDAALDFGKSLFAKSVLDRPQEISVAADMGRATFAGIEANDLHARIKVDANGLQLDRVSIGDFAGGNFAASGRIETSGHAPRGTLTFDFEATQTAAIAATVGKLSPKAVSPVTRLLERVAHAKLRATLNVTGEDKTASLAQITMAGDLDDVRIDLRARARGDLTKLSAAEIRLDTTLDTPRSGQLLKFLNLERIAAAGNGPGQLKVQLAGPLNGDVTFDTSLSADGLSGRASGNGRYSEDQGIKFAGKLQALDADLQPLRSGGSPGALPLKMTSRIAIKGNALSFDEIDAKLAGSIVRGRIEVDDAPIRRIDGVLDVDVADVPSLLARGIGLRSPASGKGTVWNWSSDPFGPGLFDKFAGRIALKFRRAELLPRLTVGELNTTLRLGKDEFALENITGSLVGGRLSGKVAFSRAQDGLTTQARISLARADAAALFPWAARPPISGSLDLNADIAGTGLSPIALVGSLKGSGKIVLVNGRIASLDPRAFDTVTRAVDHGLVIDNNRISDLASKSLEGGQLSVKRAESDLEVSAGQIHLANVSIESKDAPLSVASTLDLTDGSIAAQLDLSGIQESAGARPKIFVALKGQFTAPTRSVDASALTGWLTLRAVENQTKRLRAIESVPPQPQDRGVPKTKQAPALPAPIDIRPAPAPRSAGQPPASVRSQN